MGLPVGELLRHLLEAVVGGGGKIDAPVRATWDAGDGGPAGGVMKGEADEGSNVVAGLAGVTRVTIGGGEVKVCGDGRRYQGGGGAGQGGSGGEEKKVATQR